MSRAFFLMCVLCVGLGLWPSVGRGQTVTTGAGAAPFNDLVLAQTRAMPANGGYSASHQATANLCSAVSVSALGGLGGSHGLVIDAPRAQPSYCSGATYLVFLKTVNDLVARGDLPRDDGMFAALLISGQRDGEGVWGRWNANGPGTARLFHELEIGRNFTDFAQARPGDFMKVFWNNNVGKREHGHSVVFLGEEMHDGVPSVHFWSSNVGMGYGDKWVAATKIKAAIFSRLTAPRGLLRAGALTPKVDPYLAGLLSKDSSMAEVARMCGM